MNSLFTGTFWSPGDSGAFQHSVLIGVVWFFGWVFATVSSVGPGGLDRFLFTAQRFDRAHAALVASRIGYGTGRVTTVAVGVPSPVTSSYPGVVCRLRVWSAVRSR